MMSIATVGAAQKLQICKGGLNLFQMGSKLDDSLRPVLEDIDTSDIWGRLQFNNIQSGLKNTGDYTYKKLQGEKFWLEGSDTMPVVYVVYTKKDDIIEKILIDFRKYDRLAIKNIVDSVFGNPATETSGRFDGGPSWTSFGWKTAGIIVLFSGLGGDLSFTFPDPATGSSGSR